MECTVHPNPRRDVVSADVALYQALLCMSLLKMLDEGLILHVISMWHEDDQIIWRLAPFSQPVHFPFGLSPTLSDIGLYDSECHRFSDSSLVHLILHLLQTALLP